MRASDPQSLSRERYSRFAAAYVTSVTHAGGPDLAHLLQMAQPEAHWQVLDIATGGGHTALTFAPHVASVVASDLTPRHAGAGCGPCPRAEHTQRELS